MRDNSRLIRESIAAKGGIQISAHPCNHINKACHSLRQSKQSNQILPETHTKQQNNSNQNKPKTAYTIKCNQHHNMTTQSNTSMRLKEAIHSNIIRITQRSTRSKHCMRCCCCCNIMQATQLQRNTKTFKRAKAKP